MSETREERRAAQRAERRSRDRRQVVTRRILTFVALLAAVITVATVYGHHQIVRVVMELGRLIVRLL